MTRKETLPERKTFRISNLENKALEIMCKQEGRKHSVMLREILREAAIRRGIWPLVFVSDFKQIMDDENEVNYENS